MVSAFAFAWWLVSLPTPTWSTATSSALSHAHLAAPAHDATDSAFVGERVVVKVVTPEIIRVARGFLDLAMGEERFVAMDGKRYVFVLERHYHPPGFVGAPNGWHKGVTVYEIR